MLKKLSNIFLLLFLAFMLSGCSQQSPGGKSEQIKNEKEKSSNTNNRTLNNYPTSSAVTIADKLEIYYFHRTARCVSCKTISRYTKETLEQKYAKQIETGLIDFREINIDLSESKEIARKFQASGSSLFINIIIDDDDNIEQDANVWRLLSDEEGFKKYLENKINI